MLSLFEKLHINSVIIGCSGYNDKQTKEKAIISGMKDLIIKSNFKEAIIPILYKYNYLFNWTYSILINVI